MGNLFIIIATLSDGSDLVAEKMTGGIHHIIQYVIEYAYDNKRQSLLDGINSHLMVLARLGKKNVQLFTVNRTFNPQENMLARK